MADTRRLPGPRLTHWDWQLAAACRGMASTTFFHPPDERGPARENRIDDAKQVCQACPVLKQCLDHALKIPEPYGIWGGLSEDERAQRLGVQSLRYPARVAHREPHYSPMFRLPTHLTQASPLDCADAMRRLAQRLPGEGADAGPN